MARATALSTIITAPAAVTTIPAPANCREAAAARVPRNTKLRPIAVIAAASTSCGMPTTLRPNRESV